MSDEPFSQVAPDQRVHAVATIVSAFTDDPVERWLYPARSDYLANFPRFVAAFAGPAFDGGTVWQLGDAAAVALWICPGAEPAGETIVSVLAETIAEELQGDAFATLEQMDAAHPEYRHWYLPWLAVAHRQQGRGLGGELLVAGAGGCPPVTLMLRAAG